MKAVIYTAILGNVDDLIEPEVKPSVRCVCFSDRSRRSTTWEIRSWDSIADTLPDYMPGHATAISRYFKLLPHRHFPDEDVTIWIDGSDCLRGDPTTIIPFDEDMILFKHPERTCIYQEMKAIAGYRKDTTENIQRATARYRSLGVPERVGLAACSMIWCRKTDGAIDFCERWWKEFVDSGMRRDQPAWAYCNWIRPCSTRFLPGNHQSNQFVKRRAHKRKVPH